MTDKNLQPCPLCGSENIQIRGTYYCYVVCLNCEAATGLCEEKEETISRWNRRYNDEKV